MPTQSRRPIECMHLSASRPANKHCNLLFAFWWRNAEIAYCHRFRSPSFVVRSSFVETKRTGRISQEQFYLELTYILHINSDLHPQQPTLYDITSYFQSEVIAIKSSKMNAISDNYMNRISREQCNPGQPNSTLIEDNLPHKIPEHDITSYFQ